MLVVDVYWLSPTARLLVGVAAYHIMRESHHVRCCDVAAPTLAGMDTRNPLDASGPPSILEGELDCHCGILNVWHLPQGYHDTFFKCTSSSYVRPQRPDRMTRTRQQQETAGGYRK
jgi:hypothetical protein